VWDKPQWQLSQCDLGTDIYEIRWKQSGRVSLNARDEDASRCCGAPFSMAVPCSGLCIVFKGPSTPNPRPTSMRLKATKDAAHPLDLMDVSAPSRDVSLDARALGSFAAKLAPEPSQKNKPHMFAFGIAYSVTAVLGKYARRTYFDKKDWVCAGTGLLAASGTAMALPLLSAGVAPTAGWALGLFLASMAMLSAESARVRRALSTALAVMGRIGHYLLCGVDGARGE
jgi:hypothetical protein